MELLVSLAPLAFAGLVVLALNIIGGAIKSARAEARRKQCQKDLETYQTALDDARKIFHDACRTHLKKIVDTHTPTLLRKARQLSHRDDYGVLHDDNWQKEVVYFVDTLFLRDPELQEFIASWRSYGFDDDAPDQMVIESYQLVREHIQYLLDEAPPSDIDWQSLTPYEYELACAQVLREHGWNAVATQASGDQGADVTASRDGVFVVLQCKQYAAPIGNKAVQEIHTAKTHYGARHAVVVSNQSYTASARQVASTTGVRLLHHDDLPLLDRILGLTPDAASTPPAAIEHQPAPAPPHQLGPVSPEPMTYPDFEDNIVPVLKRFSFMPDLRQRTTDGETFARAIYRATARKYEAASLARDELLGESLDADAIQGVAKELREHFERLTACRDAGYRRVRASANRHACEACQAQHGTIHSIDGLLAQFPAGTFPYPHELDWDDEIRWCRGIDMFLHQAELPGSGDPKFDAWVQEQLDKVKID